MITIFFHCTCFPVFAAGCRFHNFYEKSIHHPAYSTRFLTGWHHKSRCGTWFTKGLEEHLEDLHLVGVDNVDGGERILDGADWVGVVCVLYDQTGYGESGRLASRFSFWHVLTVGFLLETQRV